MGPQEVPEDPQQADVLGVRVVVSSGEGHVSAGTGRAMHVLRFTASNCQQPVAH